MLKLIARQSARGGRAALAPSDKGEAARHGDTQCRERHTAGTDNHGRCRVGDVDDLQTARVVGDVGERAGEGDPPRTVWQRAGPRGEGRSRVAHIKHPQARPDSVRVHDGDVGEAVRHRRIPWPTRERPRRRK